jgi:hypothetical protein
MISTPPTFGHVVDIHVSEMSFSPTARLEGSPHRRRAFALTLHKGDRHENITHIVTVTASCAGMLAAGPSGWRHNAPGYY